MKSLLLRTFIAIVFALGLGFSVFNDLSSNYKNDSQTERTIASNAGVRGICSNAISRLLLVNSNDPDSISRARYLFELGRNIPGTYKFRMTEFQNLKKEYITILEEGGEVEMKDSPEGMMAFIEATSRNIPFQKSITDGKKLGILKRRKIHQVFTEISKGNKVRINDLSESMSDLYFSVYGSALAAKDFLRIHQATRQILARVVQEDIARRGLEGMFTKFGLKKINPSLFHRFTRSFLGKGIGSVLFNLPVMAGFPPLYLPGFKTLKLSDELAERFVREGFTDELFELLEKEIAASRGNIDIIGLEVGERYRILRQYYMVGAGMLGAYLTGRMLFDDFHESDEEIAWENTKAELEGLGQDFDVLKERGYDITNPDALNELNPYCESVKSCLKDVQEETGVLPVKGSEDYSICKEDFDPGNQCDKL